MMISTSVALFIFSYSDCLFTTEQHEDSEGAIEMFLRDWRTQDFTSLFVSLFGFTSFKNDNYSQNVFRHHQPLSHYHSLFGIV